MIGAFREEFDESMSPTARVLAPARNTPREISIGRCGKLTAVVPPRKIGSVDASFLSSQLRGGEPYGLVA
jgi:hypothetical protein